MFQMPSLSYAVQLSTEACLISMQHFQKKHHSVFLCVEYSMAIGGFLFQLMIIINPSSDSRFKMSFSKGKNKLYHNISLTLLTAFLILLPWGVLNHVTFTVLYIPVTKHVFSPFKHRQTIVTLILWQTECILLLFPDNKFQFRFVLFC